jgi:DNA ligase-1
MPPFFFQPRGDSMNDCWQVISDLENHPSRLNKEAIIEANKDNAELLEGFALALDPLVTFNIKQVPTKHEPGGVGLDWQDFKQFAGQLSSREVTGNAARDLVLVKMLEATQEQWNNWYRRILIKDLRCGVSEKTVNKVVPNTVPIFACQLAHDSQNHESKVGGEKIIEVKLDGVRVITIVYPDGRVDQFSRNGKELANFGVIKEQLSSVADMFDEPMVLDGEVMSSSFQDLMKQVHRKSNVNADDAVLHLFDIVPLKDFQTGTVRIPQLLRKENLSEWFYGVESYATVLANIDILDYERVNISTTNGAKRFREINQQAIAGGYEGIMIKEINSPYKCKRSVDWLKMKPFIEVSLEVTAVEEGTGKNVGRLGALVCSGQDDGKDITVNVGSGLTDSMRDDIWNNQSTVIGQMVEVRADAVTQNQDGSYSLRFPRFKTFRGFEVGEKI